MPRALPLLLLLVLIALLSLSPAATGQSAQASLHALRFHGTGAGQQDRVRVRIDDDQPGPDASSPCDIGAVDFSIELWVRGTHADNPEPGDSGDQSFPDARWRDGNILLDRSIPTGSERGFGISLAGGHVRFGTGRGDPPAQDASANTIEGNIDVLDGTWHHVALVRHASTGRKVIFVDGAVDYVSPPGASRADLSYPDSGVQGPASSWSSWLVLGADKLDSVPGQRAFAGWLDEVRLWKLARNASGVSGDMRRVIPPDTPYLAANYRFEEGLGSVTRDSSNAAAPDGEVIAGTIGNGEWTAYANDPLACAPVFSGALPPGFERSLVASGFIEPTALAIASSGAVFVAQRTGHIFRVGATTTSATLVIQIPVEMGLAERGLCGIALDPQFDQNGWLYAFYTTLEPRDRVARFTVVGSSASLASELILLEHPDLACTIHHGGALAFGGDGRLFIGVGDQGDDTTAQSLMRAGGKILRIAADGTIPADNPFVATPGALPAIWASGVRNPFRMHFDAQRQVVWVGNVGSNGNTAWEELEIGARGANLGWPLQEGPNCFSTSVPCSTFATPGYQWRHDDPAFSPGLPQGCIVAGPAYGLTQFPLEYRGNLFVADHANRWIRRLVLAQNGSVVSDPMFVPAPDAGPVVDMRVGPDGALYYVTFGVPWLPPVEASRVWKVAYTGSTNVPPLPVATVSPTSGMPPMRVGFDATASSDPDLGPGVLTYHWDFGDGAVSSERALRHAYTQAGPYDAVLTVSDGASSVSSPPIRITVGNPPVPAIAAPLDGAPYVAGQTIVFSGSAVDVEDGPLPASAFSWQVSLVHAAHVHPFLGPLPGVTSGSFTIPTTGHDPADTHYEIVLRVVDSDGLDATRTVAIQPTPAPVSFATVPSGIPLSLDSEPIATPFAEMSLVGYQHHLVAPATALVGGVLYVFKHWSNGATTLALDWTAPAGGGSLRALYRAPPP